jgi:inosose dehydratase
MSSRILGRREFTFGVGAAAAALATSRVFAAGDKARSRAGDISIGYAAITWGEKGARQAISEIAAVGYPGIQLRSNILKDFPSPEALKAELAKAHLTFACYSGGGPTAEPAKRAADIEKFMTGAKFAHGAGALSVQATSPKRLENPTPAEKAAALKEFSVTLNELGKQTAAIGLPLVVHPHMGQLLQDPDELDTVMAATDPRYVKLLLDTGHFAAAGGDPTKAMKTHAKRLAMMHIKDVAPRPDSPAGKKYQFVELGQGKVDFKGLFAALRAAGYHGWVVVELDSVPAGRAPRDAAAANKAFLEKTLGMSVHSA